ncbi:hypothetical protein H310_09946 [Aphanomyces invadans]|uniref:Uncharacterized protein n=1 Tax=Aphanomyces invadans TaxID=157072 RepID=A0A024TT01_9STRA|nr:hypothetical protein H310_09946 [Aphanomyces invadans]ETV97144.1 hypothetical protein H310_09946 [Aphanomyces invadans]|eukprot:XP_008874390.1 hypothetical protein H310_09946 [Aphanomyces invadans]
MLWRVVAWLGVACLVGTSAQISGKNQVYCKKTPNRGDGESSGILTGSKCELDLLLVASAAGLGKDIKFYFQVNRTVPFVPVPVYDSISGRSTQLAEIESGSVGLVPVNFDITKIGRIDSITFQNSSLLVRKNFSEYGVETLLEPQKPVSVSIPGTYKALGWFRVTDSVTNSTNEYVAIRDGVEMKEVKAVEFRSIVYDEKTTYCWRTTNSSKFDGMTYDDQTFDSSCPITIAVANPRVANNLVPFSLAWTMKIVPNYVQNGGKGVYALGLSDEAANAASILHSTVHLCHVDDDAVCHIFSPKPYALSSPDLTGAFDAGCADFTAPGLELTKGQYVGFVHGVVAKADRSFLHVATYFGIKVDEKHAKAPDAVAQVVNKTYCWKVFAPASARNVSTLSALGGYSVDDSCPMALKLNLSTQTTTNTSLVVLPQVTLSPVKPSVVTLAMLPEGYAISLATLTVCRSNETCGPFAPPLPASAPLDYPVVDVKAVSPTAFDPATLVFREAGSYNVFFIATVDVGKGVRLDVSVMSTIQVQDAVAPVNNTTLYIAIVGGVVGFLVLAVIIWCCVRRRRKARWDRHRLQRGAMSFKENQTSTRVHSSIPMVNQRGGITEVPRLYDEADAGANPKLDLAVSHYMYNQDARRVDEYPRRVTSQYDPRSSLEYDTPPPRDEGVHLGYDDYQPHHRDPRQPNHHDYQDKRRRHGGEAPPRRANSARQPDDFRDRQLVLRDEYQPDLPDPTHRKLALKAHAHNDVGDDDYLYDTNMSPSSIRNNYGGYDMSFGASSTDDRAHFR